MGEWKEVTIKSIAKIEYGKSPKGIETPDGKYPIWGTGGLVGKSNDFLFKAPAVIVGRKGTLENPIFSEDDFWVIETAYAVLPENFIASKRWTLLN
jgi:type I restriction enzyme, S subunit